MGAPLLQSRGCPLGGGEGACVSEGQKSDIDQSLLWVRSGLGALPLLCFYILSLPWQVGLEAPILLRHREA